MHFMGIWEGIKGKGLSNAFQADLLALLAVANKRKVKATALFVVSDILNVEGWPGFVKAEYQSTYPKMARLAALF